MALGDIGSLKDTFEHETDLLLQVSTVKVADGVVAVCYSGPAGDGFINTLGVDAAGNITTPIIDQIEFELSSCFEPCFIHCHGEIFAVTYRRGANDITLKTVEINPAGAITDTVKDTQTVSAALGYRSRQCMVRPNWIAVTYDNHLGNQVIRTLYIDGAGGILPHQDEIVITPPIWTFADICQTSTGFCAVVSRASAGTTILTVAVDASGNMPATPTDTFVMTATADYHHRMINIRTSEGIFLVSHRISASNQGWIRTIDIDGSGNIGASTLGTRNFAAEVGSYTPIRKLTEGMLVLGHWNAIGELFVRTFPVNASGGIGSQRDSINLGDQDTGSLDLSPAINDMWAISFTGEDSDGFLKTIDIEGPAALVGHTEMLMGMGP